MNCLEMLGHSDKLQGAKWCYGGNAWIFSSSYLLEWGAKYGPAMKAQRRGVAVTEDPSAGMVSDTTTCVEWARLHVGSYMENLQILRKKKAQRKAKKKANHTETVIAIPTTDIDLFKKEL